MKKQKNKFIYDKLLIIGCGGHAKVITDIAKCLGIQNLYYQDTDLKKKFFLGKEVIHEELSDYNDYFIVALGDNNSREKITNDFRKKNPNSILATLIHPSSIISENCSIGNGTVVMPLCVINSFSKIGEGVIINTRSSIDHDNFLMNYSSVAPGTITGGNVKIGERSAISIGSIIKHNIEIGSDTVIGASSYVNENISNNLIAFGNPAKFIRKRKTGEKYL